MAKSKDEKEKGYVYRDVSERKGILGASQWGGALGLSTYQTPHKIWEDYFLGKEREISEELQERFDMGHFMEKVQKEYFSSKWKIKIKNDPKRKSLEKMYLSKRDSRLGCHPDGLVFYDKHSFDRDNYKTWLEAMGLGDLIEKEKATIGVECKNRDAFAYDKWGMPFTDEIPYDYLMQCYGYFECCNCDAVLLLCFSNNKQIVYVVRRVQETLDGIVAQLSDWLDRVDSGWEPEAITYSEAVELNTGARDGEVEADEDWNRLYDEWSNLKAEKKNIEEKMDAVKMQVVKSIGSNSVVFYRDSKGKKKKMFSYKQSERRTLDKDRLFEEHPEINADDYMKVTTFMELR